MTRPLASLAVLLTLALAGCSAPDATEGAASASPTRSDPFATTPSAPVFAITPVATPFGTPPPGLTPGSAYESFFTHDFTSGSRTVEMPVLPGHGATQLVIGFHPGLEPSRLRCGAANVSILVIDPTGLTLATADSSKRPVGGAGCPSALRVPDVGFTEGTWRFVFQGEGDLMGYVGSGARAREWNASYEHVTRHDFAFPANTTLLDVPPYGHAVDVTLRFEPRAAGATCQGDARILLRDPNDNIVERIDLPPQPGPADCTKARTLSDVILRPGRWTVQWGGTGDVVGSIEVGPT